MPAKAPTTDPMMVALVALTVLDDLAVSADVGALDGAELVVVVAAPAPDDVAPNRVELAAVEDVVASDKVEVGGEDDGKVVKLAKEVLVNEASEVVAGSVDCNNGELVGAVVVGLVGTLGRTLATIGATSPEAWFKTLIHIAAALVYQNRY
jgi:hypothetical protein